MSVADQGLLFNPISLALRSRLAASAAEGAAVRPSQPRGGSHAAGRLCRCARAARGECNCQPGPGISLGTQQYLLGLAYEGVGDAASAQRSFQAAVASGGLLTEDGPAVKNLAERKLTAGRPSSSAR